MNTDEMVTRVKDELLNRPDEDDLFLFPDDYYSALTRSARYYYKQVAGHYTDLLYVTQVVTSSDGGESYDLPDDHFGEMEIWLPPGPPRGAMLVNVLPDAGRLGFYTEGRKIRLTVARLYTPGLYVRWVPATVATLNDSRNSPLPSYCDEAVCLRAAYEMAKRPGCLADADDFARRARTEWSGDPDDRSDMGVLGIISRQAATQGEQTAAGSGSDAWWRGIS